MSSFEAQRQDQSSLKRRWKERRLNAIEENHKHLTQTPAPSNSYTSKFLGTTAASPSSPPLPFLGNPCRIINGLQSFRPGGRFEDDVLVSSVVPPVTVVLEGRSICQRISLDKHTSYRSLANALRQMFVDGDDGNSGTTSSNNNDFDLSNAIPGHLIAYEDMENDLLLVGDLKWNDFVRVAKRIRIIPVKANSRRGKMQES